MRMFPRILLALLIGIAVLYIAIPTALSYYDSRTKQKLLSIVAQELSPHASMAEMKDFMRRHTETYDLDLEYGSGFGGRLHQTKADKFLFDRKVIIVLNVNRRTNTFQQATVEIYYSFL